MIKPAQRFAFPLGIGIGVGAGVSTIFGSGEGGGVGVDVGVSPDLNPGEGIGAGVGIIVCLGVGEGIGVGAIADVEVGADCEDGFIDGVDFSLGVGAAGPAISETLVRTKIPNGSNVTEATAAIVKNKTTIPIKDNLLILFLLALGYERIFIIPCCCS